MVSFWYLRSSYFRHLKDTLTKIPRRYLKVSALIIPLDTNKIPRMYFKCTSLLLWSARNILIMYWKSTLDVPKMNLKCTLMPPFAYLLYTCNVSIIYPQCTINIYCTFVMYPKCTYSVPVMYALYTQNVPITYPECTINISILYPLHTQNVPTVYL